MSGKRYTEEFKIEAVKQVTDRGHSVLDVAERLGVTTKSLYDWIKRYGENAEQYQATKHKEDEIRRGNCHDNAAAERFFQLLKRERVKRKIYKTREDARRDTFDYIELFFNPKLKHGYNGNLSPAEFEKRYFVKLGSI